MNSKTMQVLKYYFCYALFLLILKNIGYLIHVSYESLCTYWFVHIPIAYLVIKFIVYNDLGKQGIYKKDIFWYILFGFTIFNILFSMPLLYDFLIILFLIILNDNRSKEKSIIDKNIAEYYKNREK